MPKRSHWRWPTSRITIKGRTGGIPLPTPGRQARFGGRSFAGIAPQRRRATLVRDIGLDKFTAQSFPTLTIAEIKLRFFDRQLFGAYEGAEKAVLNRTGAVARLTVRRSMKWRKGRWVRYPRNHPRAGERHLVVTPSPPGVPPRAHRSTGGLIRKMTYYWRGDTAQSVIVGPALLSRSNRYFRSSKTIPQVHEEGGNAQVLGSLRSGFGSDPDAYTYTKGFFPAHYPKRPFIKPAFDQTLPKFRQWWKDSMNRRGILPGRVSGTTSST